MVKQGYKQTEIGVIPEDWEVKSILDITENIIDYRGVTPKKLGMDWGNGDIVALSAGNVKKGYIDFNIESYLGSETLYKRWMRNGDAKKDDIVFTLEAPLGNVALIPDNKKYILSQRTILLQPYITINSKFVFQKLISDSFQKSIFDKATGSTAQGIKRQVFEKIQIPLPPLPEQEAIASALSDADAWIESLAQLIAKKRLIKQGAIQELLTPPDGTQSGVEPWEVKTLGEVCSYRNGKALESYFSKNEGLKVISIGNYSLKSKYIDNGIRISESHINLLNQYVVKKGEFTMIMNDKTSTGEIIGRCLYIDEANKYIINQRSMILAINNSYINDYFFYHLMNSPIIRKIIFKEAKTGTQIYVNTNDVLELKISFPKSLSEQERIARILSDMDAELEALEQQLAKARQIKQGMMQELLTGRIRL